jgi:uncharacterized Ntn-hydrolase superfamily protein
VATQSIAVPAVGPRLLERLAAGARPNAALEGLVAEDESARFRQVAVVDVTGAVAAHTGDGCIPEAGHLEGVGWSVQANMMASAGVWPAMAEAFASADGPLARRLLAALDAGEAAGGDVRGRQSAALVVVPAVGEPWRRSVDLRVEDDPEPLAELRRLLDLRDAYTLMDEADQLSGQGRYQNAADRFVRAAELTPENPELLFWGGLGMAQQGEVEQGVALVRRAIEQHEGWADLLERLTDDIAPAAAAVRAALGIEG